MTVSLYDRLGGYDALATFAALVVGNAQTDDLQGRIWAHRNEERNARDLQSLIDYLVSQTGGQMYYRGRDIALAHKGMGVTGADWSRFVEIVVGAAGELGIDETEEQEVMAFLNTLTNDIVTA